MEIKRTYGGGTWTGKMEDKRKIFDSSSSVRVYDTFVEYKHTLPI